MQGCAQSKLTLYAHDIVVWAECFGESYFVYSMYVSEPFLMRGASLLRTVYTMYKTFNHGNKLDGAVYEGCSQCDVTDCIKCMCTERLHNFVFNTNCYGFHNNA